MTERNDSRDVSHLPKCLQIVGKGSGPCVCWLLRACEERVLNKVIERAELTFRSDVINPVRDVIEPLLDRNDSSDTGAKVQDEK